MRGETVRDGSEWASRAGHSWSLVRWMGTRGVGTRGWAWRMRHGGWAVYPPSRVQACQRAEHPDAVQRGKVPVLGDPQLGQAGVARERPQDRTAHSAAQAAVSDVQCYQGGAARGGRARAGAHPRVPMHVELAQAWEDQSLERVRPQAALRRPQLLHQGYEARSTEESIWEFDRRGCRLQQAQPAAGALGASVRAQLGEDGFYDFLSLRLPYWALNSIVLLLAGFSKPVRGRFADPHAAGARLSTARYQFNLT